MAAWLPREELLIPFNWNMQSVEFLSNVCLHSSDERTSTLKYLLKLLGVPWGIKMALMVVGDIMNPHNSFPFIPVVQKAQLVSSFHFIGHLSDSSASVVPNNRRFKKSNQPPKPFNSHPETSQKLRTHQSQNKCALHVAVLSFSADWGWQLDSWRNNLFPAVSLSSCFIFRVAPSLQCHSRRRTQITQKLVLQTTNWLTKNIS